MNEEKEFEYVYMDSTGFKVYELTEQEKLWLLSEDRPQEFWMQRQPIIGKYGGYVLRSDIKDIDILPARSYHSDRSHPN